MDMLEKIVLSQLIFIFPLFSGLAMYANEFETNEKHKLTKMKKLSNTDTSTCLQLRTKVHYTIISNRNGGLVSPCDACLCVYGVACRYYRHFECRIPWNIDSLKKQISGS